MYIQNHIDPNKPSLIFNLCLSYVDEFRNFWKYGWFEFGIFYEKSVITFRLILACPLVWPTQLYVSQTKSPNYYKPSCDFTKDAASALSHVSWTNMDHICLPSPYKFDIPPQGYIIICMLSNSDLDQWSCFS